MPTMTYLQAISDAMREEMRADERVFLMGEDIGTFGGAFKVTDGLLDEFGERRVRDTPISENTIVGAGVGAAGYVLIALVLRDGGSGGALLQVFLVLLGVFLAVAFSPLVTQALVRVPLHEAADASGLLTTSIQLSQAVGVAVFGSVFLTMDVGGTGHSDVSAISGHALFLTLAWVAVTLACGAVAAVPLARTVRAAVPE